MSCIMLFLTFCKFGLLCIGGGYMLIPLLISDFAGEGKLLTLERFGNLISVSQLTPGPVGINAATFVGFLQSGFLGSLCATIGIVFPTLILSALVVSWLQKQRGNRYVNAMLSGARLAALALICYAVIIFMQLSIFTASIPWRKIFSFLPGVAAETAPVEFNIYWPGLFIAAVAAVLITRTKLKTTWIILISGVLGAIICPLW